MVLRVLVLVLAAASLACHHAGSHDGALRLDQGHRWKADASTTAAISRMRTLVDAAPAPAAQDAAALGALGHALQSELDGLIAGCRMTGDAHAQLHLYLEPLMADIGTLQSPRIADARAAQAAIRERVADYARWFE